MISILMHVNLEGSQGTGWLILTHFMAKIEIWMTLSSELIITHYKIYDSQLMTQSLICVVNDKLPICDAYSGILLMSGLNIFYDTS